MERFFKIFQEAAIAVRAFKLRTFFCLASVALGISSITIIVAATEGAYQQAFEMVERFGPDSLMVLGGSETTRAVGHREKTITLDHVRAVEEAFSSAYVVVPMTAQGNIIASYRERRAQTRVIGSTHDYSQAWTWPVVQGSDLTENDVRGLRNVALLGHHLVETLFGQEDPVGKYIFVNRIPTQVVGVLASRGTSPAGHNLDDRIIMPITTVMRKIQNETRYINNFRIRFVDARRLESHEQELRSFLRELQGTPEGAPDDFRIISPKEIIGFLVALTGSLVAFLGIVGVMSLVVAGFVLANLFLLSVKERTKEIGIRRSVGAKKGDIRFQFLCEAVLITSLGGLAGFALGVAGAQLLTTMGQFPIHFSWRAFAVGLGLSWTVGILFGLQPASRAANLKPIEALRS